MLPISAVYMHAITFQWHLHLTLNLMNIQAVILKTIFSLKNIQLDTIISH